MGKVQSNNYWSSTTNANNTNNAWNVNMNNGNVNNDNKNNDNYVWPVRGGEWKASCTAPHLFSSNPLTLALSRKGRGDSAGSPPSLNAPTLVRGGDEGEGDLFSFRNLYRNYIKCRKNKRNTINALNFEVNAEENLFRLSEELQNRRYRPSRSICFVVERPKMREIIAADFRDRVVHHLLVEQLEKIYEPVFIHDSYACRAGKGVHSAVERVRDFLRQGTANGNKRFYGIHLDIRNFFMTIDKEILFGMIEKKVRKTAYNNNPLPPFSKGEYLDKGRTAGNSPSKKGEYLDKGRTAGNSPSKKGEYIDKGHSAINSPLTKGDRGGCYFVDVLLWLAGVIIFHNPADNCIVKGNKDLIPHLPPHKSLFHAGEGRGLPIGNLTSQFFANVYLNALDQYVKHTLKCRSYIRYCDDLHILDESPERLETVHEKVRLFVEDELRLKLNEKHGRVTPVTNGIDCLGYIVRPDYTLARRRAVNNLKQRLDWFEKQLVDKRPPSVPPLSALRRIRRGEKGDKGGCEADMEEETRKQPPSPPLLRGNFSPNSGHLPCSAGLVGHDQLEGEGRGEGYIIIKYNNPLIEQLRAVVASYWGHLKWANTYHLRTAIIRRYSFLKEVFVSDSPLKLRGDGGVTAFDSGRFYVVGRNKCAFPSVKSQYSYYAARFNKCAVFFQVGCFYEVYAKAAWARQLALKQLKENKRGALYGFPVKLRDKYIEALLAKGCPVVFVEETGNYIGRLKERLPARKYENINMRMEAYV